MIRPCYVARLIPYTTYETVEIASPRGIRPDVGIWEQQRSARLLREATAVMSPALSESESAWVSERLAARCAA